MMNIWDKFIIRWSVFTYNFGWRNYVEWLDGGIAKISIGFPIIGYLILFNDAIVRNLSFFELTSVHSHFGLSGGARLKFIYIGLLFIGISNLIYRVKRPYVLRLARDAYTFVEMGLKNFTIGTFIDLHEQIRYSGVGEFTRHGAYYDDEWDAFLDRAVGKGGEGDLRSRNPKALHWNEAKSQYEGLLRDILIETFFRESTQTRRSWLVICLLIAAFGYICLAIPSLDLFIKVIVEILYRW